MLFSLIGFESDHWLYLSLTHSQTVDFVGRRLYRCDSFFAQMPISRGGGFARLKCRSYPWLFGCPLISIGYQRYLVSHSGIPWFCFHHKFEDNSQKYSSDFFLMKGEGGFFEDLIYLFPHSDMAVAVSRQKHVSIRVPSQWFAHRQAALAPSLIKWN